MERLTAATNYYVAVFAFDPLSGVMKSEPSDTKAVPIVYYQLLLTLTRHVQRQSHRPVPAMSEP